MVPQSLASICAHNKNWCFPEFLDQKLQQQQRGTVCPLQVVNYVNQGLNESGVSEERSNRFK